MTKIKMLDEDTIQKIAAGEIIERPASVVKELIENCLDANSTSITVEIVNGGKNYIRVTDDGDGFTKEDLKIAFKRHSTSKLNRIEELYNLVSFGFRGEALASISAVSKLEVLTKVKANASGLQAFVENGEVKKLMPVGCPKGTTIIIRDLFYNLPVRKEFLKGDIIEANHINDLVSKLALGNSGIAFKFIKDNKTVFHTTVNNDLKSNIYTLLGKDYYRNLLRISFKLPSLSVHGYISNNTFYRGNRNYQYLYVNNRYVKNKAVMELIEENYKSIIPINRFPVFVMFINVNPSLIDINIHPTKQEIKFIKEKEIFNALRMEIRNAMKDVLSIPKISIGGGRQEEIGHTLPLLYEENLFTNHVNKVEHVKDINHLQAGAHNNRYTNEQVKENCLQKDVVNINKIDFKHILENGRIIGTIFSTFILIENIVLDRIFLIDQHAAHERILYERYRNELQSESVAVQNLLVPEVIELNELEIRTITNSIPLLNNLGFIIEEFGANSVILRGVPILFGKPQAKELFMYIVDNINPNIKSGYEIDSERIIKMACSKAIKSGDLMKDKEIESLIYQLGETENPYTCPHGRPTILEINRRDIEKDFKRIL